MNDLAFALPLRAGGGPLNGSVNSTRPASSPTNVANDNGQRFVNKNGQYIVIIELS
jgi:hypothetical protein